MVDPNDGFPAIRSPKWIAPVVFGVLSLAMFADILLGPGGWIPSTPDADLSTHFVASRAFGFGELARGNLPLWSPQMFSGYAYFGGFQPALLYPPNWLHLFLPLDVAINLTIVLHTFAAGYFTYLWLRHAGLHLVASMAGGVTFMFCARFFLHIYAGHLPHICLMPWVPILLLSIDGIMQRWRLGYALLGAGAVSMMILAGYPQMVYFTAVVMPLYGLVRWFESPRKWAAVGGLMLIGISSLGITAAQVLAGRDAVAESTRAGGTRYGFATSFSFPPENLLTLFAPDVLGPMKQGDGAIGYFGQAYLWEVSTFIGATAFLLAILGAFTGGRRAWLAVGMIGFAGVLGLGANTPIHRLFYDYLPGFSSFRGSSKFFFLVSLFMAQLAAIGLDTLFRRRAPIWIASTGVAFTLIVLALAVWVRSAGDDGMNSVPARAFVRMTERSILFHDEYFKLSRWNDPQTIVHATAAAAKALFIASAWLAGAVALLVIAIKRPHAAAYGLAGLLTIELFIFARTHRPAAPLAPQAPKVWTDGTSTLPPDARLVRNPSSYPHTPPRVTLDAWGYDPGVLKRYAELMFASQGFDPDGASSELFFRLPSRAVFAVARITLVLEAMPQANAYRLNLPLLPPATLVPSARVMESRDAMFNVLVADGFDPSYTVLLESPPPFAIVGRTPRPVELKLIDSDTREINCDVVASSMLLIGESYSKHWTITPLTPPPAGQAGGYIVMPANWAFIGVPLAAGKHSFRLEYSPPGWRVGRWVSLGSVFVTIGLIFLTLLRRGRLGAPARGDDGSNPVQ